MLAVAVGLACAATSTTPAPPAPAPRLAGPVIGRDEIPRASRSAPLRGSTTTTRPAPSASPGQRRTRRPTVVPPRAITMSRPASPPTPAPRGGTWACIVAHESGGNPTAENSKSGASGLVGFLDSTWHSMGMSGEAADYPGSVQMAVAYRLQARAGWSPWRGDGCV